MKGDEYPVHHTPLKMIPFDFCKKHSYCLCREPKKRKTIFGEKRRRRKKLKSERSRILFSNIKIIKWNELLIYITIYTNVKMLNNGKT